MKKIERQRQKTLPGRGKLYLELYLAKQDMDKKNPEIQRSEYISKAEQGLIMILNTVDRKPSGKKEETM